MAGAKNTAFILAWFKAVVDLRTPKVNGSFKPIDVNQGWIGVADKA